MASVSMKYIHFICRQKAVENPYSRVSSGYAHSGPLSGDGTDGAARPQAAAAVPTYAAVDKSKKKKKKKDKKKKDEKERTILTQRSTLQRNLARRCVNKKSHNI